MNESVGIPGRFGFGDVRGFVDYFAHVMTLDASFFVPEDFVPPELQWARGRRLPWTRVRIPACQRQDWRNAASSAMPG